MYSITFFRPSSFNVFKTSKKEMKRSIVLGGLVVAGVVAAGYRAYELKKLRKEIEAEENVIDIKPEAIEDTQE